MKLVFLTKEFTQLPTLDPIKLHGWESIEEIGDIDGMYEAYRVPVFLSIQTHTRTSVRARSTYISQVMVCRISVPRLQPMPTLYS